MLFREAGRSSMFDQSFDNRRQAGEFLATQLTHYADHPDTIVLALPRGGVPVGFAIAQELHLPLDVLLVRKLGVPGHEEYAMGAITGSGLYVLRDDMVAVSGVERQVIEEAGRREMNELHRREELYRHDRPMLQPQDKTVILVDDGMATGSSMLAAVRALHVSHPARIAVAVPVGSPDACAIIEKEVDELVCPLKPEYFRAVSLWYHDFAQTSDDEVRHLLQQAATEHAVRQAMPGAAPDNPPPAPQQGTNGTNPHHQR